MVATAHNGFEINARNSHISALLARTLRICVFNPLEQREREESASLLLLLRPLLLKLLSAAGARKEHWCPAQRIMAPTAVVTDASVADQPAAGIIRPDVTVEDAKQAVKEHKRKKKSSVESVSLAKLFSLADTQDLVSVYCST
jgi:hypothetical protein